MRVLIVDDNKTIQKIHSNLITDLNHEVVGFAADGLEGIEMYKELTPDVVLSDIDMPNMNGVEMTREIMAFDSFAKIVLVSAFESEESLSGALSSESVDYVRKPIQKADLKDILDKIETGS